MQKIIDYLKNNFSRIPKFYVFGLLLISIILNIYLGFDYYQNKKFDLFQRNFPSKFIKNQNRTYFESPYGYKSETYSKYEDGKWKTYSTSTPITENEMNGMQEDLFRRQKFMDEYFRRQRELMWSFWRSI